MNIIDKIDEIERLKFADLEARDINFLLKNYDDITDKGDKLLVRWMSSGEASGLQQVRFLEKEGDKVSIKNLAVSAQDWLIDNDLIDSFLADILKADKVSRKVWQYVRDNAELALAKKFARREDAPVSFVSFVEGGGAPAPERQSKPRTPRSEKQESESRSRKGKVAEPPFSLIVYATPKEAKKAAAFLKDDGDLNDSQRRLARKLVAAKSLDEVAELIESYKKRHHLEDVKPKHSHKHYHAARVEKTSSGRARRIVSENSPSDEDLDRSNDTPHRKSSSSKRVSAVEKIHAVFGSKTVKNSHQSDDSSDEKSSRRPKPVAPNKARNAIRSVRRPS